MRGLHNVSESYIDVAKVIPHISVLLSLTQHFPNQNLLPSVAHLPSMETLHSIILLSWFEHSHHRLPGISRLKRLSTSTAHFTPTGFRTFCAMAFKMADHLGLQDPTSIEMCISEYERHRRRTTMAAIMHLHMTYNSGTFLSIHLRLLAYCSLVRQ